jgi:hypothetical protein
MNNHSCRPRRVSHLPLAYRTKAIKMNGLGSVVCNRMGAMRQFWQLQLQHYYYVPNSSLSKVRAFDE